MVAPSACATIVDAGGRYGIHPSWRGFGGEFRYHLFEPDPGEARRLALKYKDRPEIVVAPFALAECESEIEIHRCRHAALSSRLRPNPRSVWFSRARPEEGEVLDSYTTRAATIDGYARDQNLQVDFLKVNTGGSEYDVLLGASEQLGRSILGVRLEAYFEPVYEGSGLFPEIFSLLREKGFRLLRLDYDGHGTPLNKFVGLNGYGILEKTDAIWIKDWEQLLASGGEVQSNVKILKLAAFCLMNNAPDVALHLLEQMTELRKDPFRDIAHTDLYRFVDVSVQRLFNDLKKHPTHDEARLASTYRQIFQGEMKRMHEFYESEEINPD